MVSFESLGAVSYSSSIITNYRSILHQFRDKVRYWSKIVIFSYPFEFDVPAFGGFLGNISISFGVEKLEWWS